MQKRIEIHAFNRIYETSKADFQKSKKISEKNKRLVFKFLDDCFTDGLTVCRLAKYVFHLKRICLWLGKDLDKATAEDIRTLMGQIRQKQYSAWTLNDFQVALKKFYKWHTKTDKPAQTSWMKGIKKGNNERLPEDLLNEQDIFNLLKACVFPRDQAMISLLYETGCRVGELGNIRIKNIVFEDQLCKVDLNGKTGPRRVPVLTCRPYLTKWLEVHPLKSDPEAPFFCMMNYSNRPLMYSTIKAILKRISIRAGIKKKTNPHAFRHARATALASEFPEAMLKMQMGWTKDSNMASTYVHLNGRDLDAAFLGMHGLKSEKKDIDSSLKSVTCLVCQSSCEPTSSFCGKCGNPLSAKIALSAQTQLENRKAEDAFLSEAFKHDLQTLFKKIADLEKRAHKDLVV